MTASVFILNIYNYIIRIIVCNYLDLLDQDNSSKKMIKVTPDGIVKFLKTSSGFVAPYGM